MIIGIITVMNYSHYVPIKDLPLNDFARNVEIRKGYRENARLVLLCYLCIIILRILILYYVLYYVLY